MFGVALLVFQQFLSLPRQQLVTLPAQPVRFGSFPLAVIAVAVSHGFTNTLCHPAKSIARRAGSSSGRVRLPRNYSNEELSFPPGGDSQIAKIFQRPG
jgi:hypothetical protein